MQLRVEASAQGRPAGEGTSGSGSPGVCQGTLPADAVDGRPWRGSPRNPLVAVLPLLPEPLPVELLLDEPLLPLELLPELGLAAQLRVTVVPEGAAVLPGGFWLSTVA